MPLSFEPRLDILPESQRKVWPQLDDVPSHLFCMEARASRFNSDTATPKTSIFFSAESFDPDRLKAHLPFSKSWTYRIRMLGCIANLIISRPSPTWAEDR